MWIKIGFISFAGKLAVSAFGRCSTIFKREKTTLTSLPQKNTTSYLDIEAFEKQKIIQFAIADEATMIDEKSLAMVWDGVKSGLFFPSSLNLRPARKKLHRNVELFCFIASGTLEGWRTERDARTSGCFEWRTSAMLGPVGKIESSFFSQNTKANN